MHDKPALENTNDNSLREDSAREDLVHVEDLEVWTTSAAEMHENSDIASGRAFQSNNVRRSKSIPKSVATGNATVEFRAGGAGEDRSPSTSKLVNTIPAGGRYLIGNELGNGGIGIVLSGWDIQLGREVAIKVLRDEYKNKPAIVRRFFQEARFTSHLQHHGIPSVHSVGVSPDNRPFFVMKLIDGETFDRVLARRTNHADDLPHLLTVFKQISETISFAHVKGIVHRDLKPLNIMVGPFGDVKVIDWGLAKRLGELEPSHELSNTKTDFQWATSIRQLESAPPGSDTSTLMGAVLGTPAYLSPEQARGNHELVDHRADIFGLGGLLCEILTGFPPYTGIDTRQVFRKAMAGNTAEAIARINQSPVPVSLIELTIRCLSAEMNDRPQSAAEVVDVITQNLLACQRQVDQDLVAFFDSSLDLFCIASTSGFFHRINKHFSDILGYTISDLQSRPFLEFVHLDDHENTMSVLDKLNCGETCIGFTNRYRHADGHYVLLEWNAQVVPDQRAIYAVARHITNQPR